MTAYRQAYIYCDVCDHELDDQAPTIAEIRSNAFAAGWHRVGGADFCPDCWADSSRRASR